MKREIKAALLSAFLFPGLGHLYLRRYLRGLLFMAVGLVCIVALAAVTALAVWEQLGPPPGGSEPVDPGAIVALVGLIREGPFTGIIGLCFWGCWLWAAIDAYRLGKRADFPKGE